MARGNRSHGAAGSGSTGRSGSSSSSSAAVKRPSEISKTLIPGRHACACQARVHELVRNCLGCGKIVCQQEGSGPCLVCDTLVCTREEREILERGSRKSAELYKKLTGKDMPQGKLGGHSLEGIAEGMKTALTFRDTLLEADADSERRTHVNDLESDFANIEKDQFLSKEEREAIMRRRDELRMIREKRRRALVVDINYATMQTSEQRQDMRETDAAYDPVIRRILDRSEDRRKAAELLTEQKDYNEGSFWRSASFVPKYLDTSALKQRAAIDEEHEDAILMGRQSAEAAALEVERRGYALPLPQPLATLVANGFIKHYRWREDPMLVGPLFVCSSPSRPAGDAAQMSVDDAIAAFNLRPAASVLDYSAGAVLGRAYLAAVLTKREYEEEFGDVSGVPGQGKYVLQFTAAEPLITSIPHIPASLDQIYTLDPQLKSALSQVFSG